MPVKKSQERWGDAHVRLRKLFDERAGMSQLEFAERFGLGTQGMVWQYLSGYRPLNYEAAAKFARGLNCRIDDFSPEMAESLRQEILPVLGRAAKLVAKAALFLVFLLPPLLADRSHAATHNAGFARNVSVVCIRLNSLLISALRHIRGAAASVLTNCRTTGQLLRLTCA